jgi:hypothetical protein
VRTTVTGTATDTSGVPWKSSADFQAGADGKVTLAQKPLSGYPSADPMGLFELMTPARGDAMFFTGGRTLDVTLEASVDGKVVAQAIAHRLGPEDLGVRRRDLRPATDGVYGTLFVPADTSTRRPALVVFGGSEGGLSGSVVLEAALLAAHGYPALALAYFHEPGLPATLTNVPLEYFARALRLLRSQPGVDLDHVLVQGVSRGGEGALRRSGRGVAALHPRGCGELPADAGSLPLPGDDVEVPGRRPLCGVLHDLLHQLDAVRPRAGSEWADPGRNAAGDPGRRRRLARQAAGPVPLALSCIMMQERYAVMHADDAHDRG